jgi:hypothetical protein
VVGLERRSWPGDQRRERRDRAGVVGEDEHEALAGAVAVQVAVADAVGEAAGRLRFGGGGPFAGGRGFLFAPLSCEDDCEIRPSRGQTGIDVQGGAQIRSRRVEIALVGRECAAIHQRLRKVFRKTK